MGNDQPTLDGIYKGLCDDKMTNEKPDVFEALRKLAKHYIKIGGFEGTTMMDALDAAEAERDELRTRIAELEAEPMPTSLAGFRAAAKSRDKRIGKVESAIRGLLELVDGSRGLDGWHLNGDTATWDEFEEPGIAREALGDE